MKRMLAKAVLVTSVLVTLATLAPMLRGQQQTDPGAARVQATSALYAVIPISATAAVNNQVTLTIPAPPPGLYNYICSFHYNVSQNGTATANTNSATTSTNFNGYAIKYSYPATVNGAYDWVESWGEPSGGCAKSTSPGTATTFVSPSALAQAAFTMTATYFQAP